METSMQLTMLITCHYITFLPPIAIQREILGQYLRYSVQGMLKPNTGSNIIHILSNEETLTKMSAKLINSESILKCLLVFLDYINSKFSNQSDSKTIKCCWLFDISQCAKKISKIGSHLLTYCN